MLVQLLKLVNTSSALILHKIL